MSLERKSREAGNRNSLTEPILTVKSLWLRFVGEFYIMLKISIFKKYLRKNLLKPLY